MSDEPTPGPWVWCDWTILDEDRPAQGRGEPYWTMIAGSSALARGPLGRKSMWPESIIEALGYEVEGVAPATEADGRLIAAAPDLLEALKELLKQHWEFREYFEDIDSKARNKAHAAIAKAKVADVATEEQGFAVSGEGTGSPHG